LRLFALTLVQRRRAWWIPDPQRTVREPTRGDHVLALARRVDDRALAVARPLGAGLLVAELEAAPLGVRLE
jgi:hypothetical protein